MPKLKKILNYTQETLLSAIDEVKNGCSVKATAKKFGIPRVTLLYKVKGKLPIGKRMGPKGIFTPDQEDLLAKWVIRLARAGFPITKDIFMVSVAKLATELGVNVPGEKWYKLFRGRHPNITNRIYQNLTKSRASVTQENIRNWFKEVETYLTERNLFSILEDSTRVFNADETAFFLNPKGSKVLAEKGSKVVYLAGANDEKENITTLLTANAAGQIAPPMIVFRYKRIPLNIAETVPSHWAIGRSENGWMTQELFFEYIANFFIPWLKKENITLPVVFFLDGHSSHMSYHLSDLCFKSGIILVALYPNATHILQLMDVAVFHSLKSSWRKRVTQWRMPNMGQEIKKKDFPPLLDDVLQNIQPSILQNGFKKCGLMPWDSQAISFEKTDMSEKKQDDIKIKSFLDFLEQEIGEEKMVTFNNNEGTWKGQEEDLSLYNIWKINKLKLEASQVMEENGEDLEGAEIENRQDYETAEEFLRYVAYKLHIPNDSIDYNSLMSLLNLRTLESRRVMNDQLLVCKLLKNYIDCPDLLALLNINVPARSLRAVNVFAPEHHRTLYGQFNSLNRAMILANDIELDVFTASVNSIKNASMRR